MVIQRLPEQSVFMLGQGLSINLFDMNRKPVDSAARPLSDHASEIMPPAVSLQCSASLLRNPHRASPCPLKSLAPYRDCLGREGTGMVRSRGAEAVSIGDRKRTRLNS